MTQVVIGVFDTPDAAYEAEETLMSQGIQESSFHLAAREGETGPASQSMDEIRSFLQELLGPENTEEIENYVEEIRRGGAVLSVDLPDDKAVEPVQEAMLDAGAMDMDELVEQWHREEQALTGEETEEERQSIPIVEEEMEIGKGQVAKGKVRVISRLEETPVEEEVSLKEETASIERRPADRPASPEELEALGEKSIEVEETAEKPVISKSARVVGEVEVGKETSERTETVAGSERHTEVEVEREPARTTKQPGKGKRGKR